VTNETNNVIKETSEATNKIQEGNKSQPSQIQNCSTGLDSSYINYTATTPTQTSISFSEAYSKISEIINQQTIGGGATPQQVSGVINTIFSLIYISSSNGQSFTTYNYNFAKVPLVFGYGDLSKKYFDQSYICLTIQNNQVPFAVFSNFNEHIRFLSEKYTQKILASQIVTTPTDSVTNTQIYIEKIAEFSTNSFPNENSNLWQSLTEQVKKQYIEKITEAISFVLSNQPKPVAQPPEEPNPPIFLVEPKYTISSPPLLESYTIKLNPAADKRKIFAARMLILGNSNAPCVDTSGEIDVTDKVINGDTFTMEIQEILDEFGCTTGQPSLSYKGTYYAKFEMLSTPIKSDGSPDPTRQDYYKFFPLTFSF